MATEAEEVGEDYRLALEDLNANMRFEISNLTVIARENTEHALIIAEVLEKHILKTAPSKKLPALYVLDSIVKNVGTPYTLYLGRNIFKIFMEAYTVVDHGTRKRMEEMLKTWKQPVAGSMDTRPVFSPDLIRPIENALMRAKAAMMPQGAQLPGRPRSTVPPHRETPTPPGIRSATGTPAGFAPQLAQYPNAGQPSYPVQFNNHIQPHPTHAPTPPSMSAASPFQPPAHHAYGVPVAAVDSLNTDIQNLIAVMRMEFSQNPHDASVHTRLGALQDLQRIVQSTSLPPDQLELIKKQVTELAAVTLRATAQKPTPSPVPPAQAQHAPSYPVASMSASAPTPVPAASGAPATLSLDSLLGSGAMAALMARQGSQNNTPNPPFNNAAIRSPQPPQAEPYRASSAQPQGEAPSLLEQLRAAGLIPAATPSSQAAPAAVAPPPPTAPMIPANIASILSSSKALSASLSGFKKPTSGLTSASLKLQYKPDTIRLLYEGLGPPCTQCGRRFRTDEDGRRKKTAHMDWHFRVHQRSSEAAKRGTHRSWYVDHQDWVRSREDIDSDHVSSGQNDDGTSRPGGSHAQQDAAAAALADRPTYIPVPDATRGINTVCPICQDKFENKWLDTAQEWVWLDAVLVGNRAYHASCHAEATRDREGTPRRRTPEPVLGKRKAEVGLASPKVRSLKTYA